MIYFCSCLAIFLVYQCLKYPLKLYNFAYFAFSLMVLIFKKLLFADYFHATSSGVLRGPKLSLVEWSFLGDWASSYRVDACSPIRIDVGDFIPVTYISIHSSNVQDFSKYHPFLGLEYALDQLLWQCFLEKSCGSQL